MSSRSIRQKRQLHCNTDHLAAPTREEPATVRHLPASFPSHLLEPDQLEAVTEWWATWQADIVDAVRHLLDAEPTGADAKHNARRADLRHLTLNSIILAHILRLHPAADNSLPILARKLGEPVRKLYYIRDAICTAIAEHLAGVHSPHHHQPRPTISQLAAAFPQLNFDHRVGRAPCYTVPFAYHCTLAMQLDTVLTLSKWPGVTARLDLTTNQADAVRITITK